MENWSYKDIDVYLSSYENILGDATPTSQYWVPLSNYGLLRSRVALTPSTVEGTAESIPGRDGKPYSTFSSRGNAKISFEILIADTWITAHKQLNKTVQERVDYICALLDNARRLSYKQPGHPADGFFEIYKNKLTLTDADEHAQTIKVEMEVHPFEFLFTGNVPITIPKTTGQITFNNSLPNGICHPSFVVPQGWRSSISVEIPNIYEPDPFAPVSTEGIPTETIIDTLNGLVYSSADTSINMNMYFDGLFSDLRIPTYNAVIIGHGSTELDLIMYSRKGIVR